MSWRSFVFVLTLSWSSFGLADGDHDDHGDHAVSSDRTGAGRAVEAFDEHEGFKLSAKATKKIGLAFEELVGAGTWSLPKSAVVRSRDVAGVYRKRDGWISFVKVSAAAEGQDRIRVSSGDLAAGDAVAIAGVSFLRMTDSDLTSTADGHSH